ncbi:MAG: acyl-CoA thioesterase [candidate division Zixibacteria bacterium]|nr:acyl-CoA thioesterase [candidate division Zixibacteria bacterium]MDH3938107.1 acyl-CoA thioesterase [candidate division Zixibacteria bacterium]MDH4035783.1 acyl-CoA thioesterase [candidate division Zixibacteria bacterium]
MAFEIKSSIKLHDTDAAGVVFFVSHFRIAHTAYEEFLQSIGCGMEQIIGGSDYLVLIAHAEADYLQPFHLGDNISISVRATKLKRVSFELTTDIKNSHGEIGATVRTVHVAIERNTGRKIDLPAPIRAGLESIK